MVALLAAAAFCTGPQLRATLELQSATGSLRGGALVHNAGRTCTLATTGATIERPGSGTDLSWEPGFHAVLPHARTAWIPIVWRNWCGAPPTRFALQLRGGAVIAMRTTGAPRFDAAGRPTDLNVGRPAIR